jgi:SAM-dependent methyltransferase
MSWTRPRTWFPSRSDPPDLYRTETTRLHQGVIRNKPLLKGWYREQYLKYLGLLPADRAGVHVEVGSGGGFLKELCPSCITSSFLAGDRAAGLVDRQLDAQAMALDSASVDSFFLLDVLHHLPDPRAFFGELQRCLKPGGVALLIEPAATLFGRFLYQRFHHEGCDDRAAHWGLLPGEPAARPNQALAHIIFERDGGTFAAEFPRLSVVALRKHTFLGYALSGGLSHDPLVPSWAEGALSVVERSARPLLPWLGTYMDVQLLRL